MTIDRRDRLGDGGDDDGMRVVALLLTFALAAVV
jgi:hypothetical protein